MHVHLFKRVQHVPITQDVAWAFLSNPANLLQLTPPWTHMADASPDLHKVIFPGMIQVLHMGLFGLIPCRWVAEITHVDAPYSFVDEQKLGPFAFWHHRHSIHPVPDGVELHDTVHYALPVGVFGVVAHGLFVRKSIEAIFNYRARMLDEFFGE